MTILIRRVDDHVFARVRGKAASDPHTDAHPRGPHLDFGIPKRLENPALFYGRKNKFDGTFHKTLHPSKSCTIKHCPLRIRVIINVYKTI